MPSVTGLLEGQLVSGCCFWTLPTGCGHQAKSSGIKMLLCEEGPPDKEQSWTLGVREGAKRHPSTQ